MPASSRRPRSFMRTTRSGYGFLALPYAVYLMFFVWPAIQMIRLSFFEWDGVTPGEAVGLANYERLMSDPLFWQSLKNTLLWTGMAVIVPVAMGLGLAILLTRSRLVGQPFFRTVFFLPQVLSSVVVAVIWGWIFNPSFGALNQGLRAIGLDSLAQGWLGSSTLALPALFLAWSWVHYGFTMIIFVAAIDGIDETYFEAAVIDGASMWQQIRFVLIPMIRGPMTMVMLVSAIAAFQVFDLVYLLTGGGPAQATSVLATFMLDAAFRFRRIGYGAAIGVILMGTILTISVLMLKIRKTFEEETA